MSKGLGIVTILGCLSSGEKLLNLDPGNWKGSNNSFDMSLFIAMQRDWRKGLEYIDPESFQSFATNSHPEILKKMAEWKMRLNDVPDGGGNAIYMISQLKEFLRWTEEGQVVNRDWPEFILKEDVTLFRSYKNNEHVVQIALGNGDLVYLTRCNQNLEGFALLSMILSIEAMMYPVVESKFEFEGVQIPCVSLDLTPDMSWILGASNDGAVITYAQQKIKFGMDKYGFAVREEAAMVAKRCMVITPEPYILSPKGESFLFWRRRNRVPFPLSMYQITKEDFKDPGDLGKIVE